MLTTILDECVNGWIVTIFIDGKRRQYIYETLHDAQEHLGDAEQRYEASRKVGVNKDAIEV